MRMVNMHQAKTTLSQLVEAALRGEEVVIARHGRPAVRLVPVGSPTDQGLRPIGLGRGGSPIIADSEHELLSATNPDVYVDADDDLLSPR